MQIGEVIRRYRRAKGLTQEAVANYLGVTAPAVNKWENGNTLPDITLLAPICRLLGVTLDELLSFRAELTEQEVRELTKELDKRLDKNPDKNLWAAEYEAAFEWARAKLAEYPSCEPLLHSFAVTLDANRLLQGGEVTEQQEEFILSCYQRLLQSSEEKMRTLAADALYGYYLRQEEYDEAEACLAYFSEQNPVRKMKRARLYEAAGDKDRAYRDYEEILFSEYQLLNCVLNSLFVMSLGAGDLAAGRYYAGKQKDLGRLFEMGEYNAYAVDLELVQAEQDVEGTLSCVRGLLENVGTLHDFAGARLFSHMSFREVEPGFIEGLREKLRQGFCDEEGFAYMQGDERWRELLADI